MTHCANTLGCASAMEKRTTTTLKRADRHMVRDTARLSSSLSNGLHSMLSFLERPQKNFGQMSHL